MLFFSVGIVAQDMESTLLDNVDLIDDCIDCIHGCGACNFECGGTCVTTCIHCGLRDCNGECQNDNDPDIEETCTHCGVIGCNGECLDEEEEVTPSSDEIYKSGDILHFNNGLGIKYDLQDGVGIRSSAQVRGNFSINSSGRVTIYVEVFHGENNISYSYIGNVRFSSNGSESFIPLSFNEESFVMSSLYDPIGFAYYNLPDVGVVTMEIYIGYEVDTGAGFFNGEYYNNTFILSK